MDLTIGEMTKILGCCRNTLMNYEARGLIHPTRDVNGYRRYSPEDVEKLKKILEARWPKSGRPAVEAGND